MAKLTLQFEFNTEIDGDEWYYENIINADNYRRLLYAIFTDIRSKNKYSEEDWSETYDLIWQLANEYNINPWEEIF
jgi:hypothetical protein